MPLCVRHRWLVQLSFLLVLGSPLACQHASHPPAAAAPREAAVRIVYRKARDDRTKLLERELTRLRADLAEAEQALVMAESGLRGSHSRADAVATVAAARIRVARARARAPWTAPQLAEATEKLHEAEQQTEAGHLGSAIFFASRAERIARDALEEARIAEAEPGALRVSVRHANLREGPSTAQPVLAVLGQGTPVFSEQERGDWLLVRTARVKVGWIHHSLLR